jgi:hypothetical protein
MRKSELGEAIALRAKTHIKTGNIDKANNAWREAQKINPAFRLTD